MICARMLCPFCVPPLVCAVCRSKQQADQAAEAGDAAEAESLYSRALHVSDGLMARGWEEV